MNLIENLKCWLVWLKLGMGTEYGLLVREPRTKAVATPLKCNCFYTIYRIGK